MGAPLYAQSAKKTRAALGTANSNRDGTGTLATIAIGVSGGTVANVVSICATGTVTEGMVRFYSNDATNKTLIGELYVQAWAPSATKPILMMSFKIPEANRNLATTNDSLMASTQNAETFHLETSFANYA